MIETVHVAVVPLKAIPGLMIILRGVAAALALSGTTTSKIATRNAIFSYRYSFFKHDAQASAPNRIMERATMLYRIKPSPSAACP